MLRSLLLLGLLVALPSLALTGEKEKAEKDKARPLEVTYHGQSFFTITSSKGTVIAFDPHAIEVYRPEKVRADIVLISHEHNEHNVELMIENRDKAKIIHGLTGPGLKANWVPIDETIKDVHVRSVGTFHDTADGMRYGRNTVFVVEVDGWK